MIAQLLELLYRAHRSFATASGVLRERRDLELGERAMRAFQEKQAKASAGGSGQSVVVGFARWGGEESAPPTELVEEIRFWFEQAHRIREEHSSDHPPNSQDGLVSVRDGGRWWRYDPRSGAMSNEQEPEVGAGVGQQLEQLLDPVDLLAGLELTILGETELLGRRAFDVRAVARPLAHHFFHRMPFGEDELRCLVDRERGVLLRKAFLFGGAELSSSEFLELVFDEPISPERFVLTLPLGEEFVSPLAHHAIRDVSVEEAARRASFPVWVVPMLPEGQWRIMVTYVQPSARPPVHEMLHVNYIRDDGPAAPEPRPERRRARLDRLRGARDDRPWRHQLPGQPRRTRSVRAIDDPVVPAPRHPPPAQLAGPRAGAAARARRLPRQSLSPFLYGQRNRRGGSTRRRCSWTPPRIR